MHHGRDETGSAGQSRFRLLKLLAIGCAICMALRASAGDKLLLIATDEAPYAYVDNFRPKGMDVDLVGRILQELGIDFEIAFYPPERCWSLLASGEADGGLGMPYEDRRRPAIYYPPALEETTEAPVEPRGCLAFTETVFFIRRRDAEAIRFESFPQLARDGYRIAVHAQQELPAGLRESGATLLTYRSRRDSVKALAAGQVDIVAMDRTAGQWEIQQAAPQTELTYLPRPLMRRPRILVFARHARYPDIRTVAARCYEALARMQAAGTCQAIRAQHVTPRFDAVYERPFRFVGAEWPPFEYEQDGKVTGINVEAAQRIMDRMGVPCEFRLYPWCRAWLMARKGHADAVLSVSYQAAREPYVYFTADQREQDATFLPQNYLWASELVFFAKNSRKPLYRLESLEQITRNGYRIGTNRGYAYTPAFRESACGTHEYGTVEQGMTALLSGEIDLYPMDRIVGESVIRRMGMADSVSTLDIPLARRIYHLPFCKHSDFPNRREIMYAVYAELRAMRARGEYQALYDRHIHAGGALPHAP